MKPNSVSDIYTDYLLDPVVSTFSERNSNSTNKFRNTGTQLSYKHNFPKNGQEFTADVTYNLGKNDNTNVITTNYYTLPGNVFSNSYLQRQDGYATRNRHNTATCRRRSEAVR